MRYGQIPFLFLFAGSPASQAHGSSMRFHFHFYLSGGQPARPTEVHKKSIQWEAKQTIHRAGCTILPYVGLRMNESIRFCLLGEFWRHTRIVAPAYARGLRMRHPRGIRGLGIALNFMVLQFQMYFVRILRIMVAQSQKDNNVYNYLLFHCMNDNDLQN